MVTKRRKESKTADFLNHKTRQVFLVNSGNPLSARNVSGIMLTCDPKKNYKFNQTVPKKTLRVWKDQKKKEK